MVDVIIHMDRVADLAGVMEVSDAQSRRQAIIDSLQVVAADSQAGILNQLDNLRRAGTASHIRPFWIINAVAATITPDAIPSVARLPGVARVDLDTRHQAFGQPPDEGIDGNGLHFEFAGWASPPPDRARQAADWSVAAVGAPYVWNLLGIDGKGVTIAIVDTGVDWKHPALRGNYRGSRGGSVEHAGNWFSTVTPTQTVPVDPHGHGTHVAGTAVGHRGIGVAPGAEWIAVAIADEYGRIRDSDVHAAYQWLLAPNGDPALAPDVVNNSWGTAGTYTEFIEDVAVLEAAGIVTVFAAGNTGPAPATINAPASYPGVISVAATDDTGAITWFSSRGPSPLTSEAKPLLSAPGARVLSAYPDNRYALMNGTSMAAPHVSGGIALMLSAEPQLTTADIHERLVAAAGHLIHEPDRGWGALDAYAAVAPLLAGGRLMGQISGSPSWAEASIALKTPSGIVVEVPVNAQGSFSIPAVPGRYQVRASAFGFKPSDFNDVELYPGHTTRWDVTLEPRPGGSVSVGLIGAGELVGGAVQVSTTDGPTPIQPVLGPNGRYSLALPAGSYRLEARVPGNRLSTLNVTIQAGDSREVDLMLEPGPRLLLVDSGSWQYRSEAAFFAEALEDNGVFADYWPIQNPNDDLPAAARMDDYDAVIWSAPYDSPGYLGANDIITDYLGLGGRLLISGQNVANYDGANGVSALWWTRLLEARWLADSSPDAILSGMDDTAFAGGTYTLNGPQSAANQVAPDQVSPIQSSLTRPVIRYPDGSAAGLLSHRCEPFRLLYFGFGLEGVTGRADRAQLMAAILETLLGHEEERAAVWQTSPPSDFVIGGEQLAYTATLRNLSRTMTQTFRIEANGGVWARSILTPTLTLAPCGAGQTALRIEVPPNLPRDARHAIQWIATLGQGDAAELTVSHKSPGSVLLVDDDRFIQTEDVYEEALDRLDIAYDLWETGWPEDVRGSPSSALLRAYDLIIWFTGYDWFEPLTREEAKTLIDFLEDGGRLFLSSQDALYRHSNTPLARNYLGVDAYQESITPTLGIFDERVGAPSELRGILPLHYGGYQNFSDGVIPAPDALPMLWHNQGSLAGTSMSGVGATGEPWRAVFWALPFESLPVERQPAAMATILGQLSDIADSEFTVDRRSGAASEPRVYSLTIVNSANQPRQIWLTNTLPISLTYRRSSSDITYDSASRLITWSGVLAAGGRRVFTYTVDVNPTGAQAHRIDNVAVLRYAPFPPEDPANPFAQRPITKTTTTWINVPDLSASQLSTSGAIDFASDLSREQADPYHVITYALTLQNSSVVTTQPMTATIVMPQELEAIESSITSTHGAARLEAWRLVWSGVLLPGEIVTTSVVLTQTMGLNELYPAAAYVDDGVTDVLVRPVIYYPLPYRSYVPLLSGPP